MSLDKGIASGKEHRGRRRGRHKKTLCRGEACGWCLSNRKGKKDAVRGTISDEFLVHRRRHNTD